MSCPTPEQIELLKTRALASDEAEGLRTHIVECKQCRQRYRTVLTAAAGTHDYPLDPHVSDDTEILPLLSRSDVPADAPQMSGTSMDYRLSSSIDLQGDHTPPLSIPADFFPGYRLIRELHRGGQGVVYEALQLATERTVALKVLLEGILASDRVKWRFEREIKLIAAMKHPNIVVIHDSNIVQGMYYFAMDYVRGQPLDTHVRLSSMSVSQIIKLFMPVCDAVGYAHRRGVIHRDLKPSNILVGESGAPCVLDFGLAKVIGEELQISQAPFSSITGNILGTVPYMSPEQTLADPDAIDSRTDVYALGVILYELLTGSPPYDTRTELAIALQNIRAQDPVRPSKLRREISSELDMIILRAMEKEPERRYRSADDLLDDLQAWLDGRPISAKSASSLYVIRKIAAKHRYETGVIVLLLLSLIGFAGVSYYYYRNAANALAERDDSRAVAGNLVDNWENAGAAARATIARNTFGWFLAEWYAGRLDRARQIHDTVASNAPEYGAIMEFLLNDAVTLGQLQVQIPKNMIPIAEFAAGEKALKHGDRETARRYFGSAAYKLSDQWLIQAARARLAELGSLRPETRSASDVSGQ